MKKLVLVVIALILQAALGGPLRAQETVEDPNPRLGIPNLPVSFSTGLAEQAILFAGFDSRPSKNAANRSMESGLTI